MISRAPGDDASFVIDPAAHVRPGRRLRRCGPALSLFAAAAAGAALGRFGRTPPVLWFVGAAATAGCATLTAFWSRRRVEFAVCALAATALLLAGWTALRVATPTPLERRLADLPDGAVVMVEGVVEDRPAAFVAQGVFAPFSRAHRQPQWRFALRTRRVGSPGAASARERTRGKLWVWSAQQPAVEPGQRVRVVGAWRTLRPPTNPGEADRRLYARERGFAGELRVEDASTITHISAAGSGAPGAVHRLVWRVRTRAARALDALTNPIADPQTRALARALLLGERTAALAPLQEAGQATGLAHILAISGLHMAAIAWLAAAALRLFRDWGRLELLLVGAVVLLYAAALPLRAPALRATIMILAFLAAELAGRRWDSVATLALAATLTLAVRPMELFSAGFVLSYSIVAGLILGAPLLDRVFPGAPSLFPQATPGRASPSRSRAVRTLRWTLRQARSVFVVGLCAWLVSTPIAAWRFGVASLWTPLLSVAALPLLLAVVAVGGAGVAIASALPAAGAWLAPLLAPQAKALAWLMTYGASLPGAGVRVPPFPLWWVIAAEGAILLWFARPARGERRIPAAATAVVAAALALTAPVRNGLAPQTAFRLDMLDVGDGSCLLLRSGGQAALWDCGSQAISRVERIAPLALRALGVSRLRYLFLTHADMDHYAAAPRVARALRIEQVVVSPMLSTAAERDPEGPAAALLAALKTEGATIVVASAGDVFALGDSNITLLWPPASPAASRPVSDNASSLAAVVETPTAQGRTRTLLTGDLGLAELQQAVEQLGPGRIDAMEAPHHGSAATGGVFLIPRLGPRFVLQSTGPSRLADPRLEPLKHRARWLVTAAAGAATFTVARDGAVRAWSFLGSSGDR